MKEDFAGDKFDLSEVVGCTFLFGVEFFISTNPEPSFLLSFSCDTSLLTSCNLSGFGWLEGASLLENINVQIT